MYGSGWEVGFIYAYCSLSSNFLLYLKWCCLFCFIDSPTLSLRGEGLEVGLPLLEEISSEMTGKMTSIVERINQQD
jgi:hypothetical protein